MHISTFIPDLSSLTRQRTILQKRIFSTEVVVKKSFGNTPANQKHLENLLGELQELEGEIKGIKDYLKSNIL